MRACWSILNLKSIEWQLQLKLQMVLKRSQSWFLRSMCISSLWRSSSIQCCLWYMCISVSDNNRHHRFRLTLIRGRLGFIEVGEGDLLFLTFVLLRNTVDNSFRRTPLGPVRNVPLRQLSAQRSQITGANSLWLTRQLKQVLRPPVPWTTAIML